MQLSALKTNLKQRDRQVDELEKANKKLSWAVSQLKDKLKIKDNDAGKRDRSNNVRRKEIERKLIDYKNDILKLI